MSRKLLMAMLPGLYVEQWRPANDFLPLIRPGKHEPNCKEIASGRLYAMRPGPAILLGIMVLLSVLMMTGCGSMSTPPVAKLGVIAPFEGPSRPLGYSVLYAMQLRIQEWNEAGQLPRVELVALNDDGDPEMGATLAAQLAADPDIMVVLGPPQSHTALKTIPALAAQHLPTISLAPLSEPVPAAVVPLGGIVDDLQLALLPYVSNMAVAWDVPLKEPSLWLGDPQTLSVLMLSSPDLIAASGPVAAEEAFAAWAGEAADGMYWAGAVPVEIPAHFSASYQTIAGSQPTPMAALAYAATDEALRLLAAEGDRTSILSAVGDPDLAEIQVFRRMKHSCCVSITDEGQ